MSDARLRWQCRRGMKELDILLERWLDRHHGTASEPEKSAFRQLLALPDPELARYLLTGEVADDPELARVIAIIRGRPRG